MFRFLIEHDFEGRGDVPVVVIYDGGIESRIGGTAGIAS